MRKTSMKEKRNLNLCDFLGSLIFFVPFQIPQDSHILRFLRAREFHVEKAREMLCHSMAWRKLHCIDRLHSSYEVPPVIDKYYSGGWHFNDRGLCFFLTLSNGLLDGCLLDYNPNEYRFLLCY